jgi:hypothetical protein
MDSADALTTIQEYLAKIEAAAELVADAGLRVTVSGGRLDVGGLAEVLDDLDAAVESLQQLLASLTAGAGPEADGAEDLSP